MGCLRLLAGESEGKDVLDEQPDEEGNDEGKAERAGAHANVLVRVIGERLSALAPDIPVNHMAKLVFGTAEPPNDARHNLLADKAESPDGQEVGRQIEAGEG